MPLLPLSPDELLSTTRAVRRRLDLTRPVEREVLEECLVLAQQAPSGSNRQQWHFMVVADSEKRAALADLWRIGAEAYRSSPISVQARASADPAQQAAHARIQSSVDFLAQHLHEVPVHLIPCMVGRPDGRPAATQAGFWGSILPATWSFMLAARARGLGTCWTTFHLHAEETAAAVLGIPYDQVTQAALIPVAYTIGTDFRPAPRQPLSTMVHWDAW